MQPGGWTYVGYAAHNGVARLTLRRPPANILDLEMLKEFTEAVEAAAEDATLKVLVVAAEGKHFSAGVDVADHTPDRVGDMIPAFDRLCLRLLHLPCVTLAVVQGHALGGGCELVACCDVALMARGARIGQPEIQLAAIAPIAALRLPALVGPRWAARLLFTGETVEADQAAAIGLITEAVDGEALSSAVQTWIERFADLSTPAIRLAKRALRIGQQGLDEGISEVEQLYLRDLMSTEDAQEGVRAFLEKRKPVWRHR